MKDMHQIESRTFIFPSRLNKIDFFFSFQFFITYFQFSVDLFYQYNHISQCELILSPLLSRKTGIFRKRDILSQLTQSFDNFERRMVKANNRQREKEEEREEKNWNSIES